MVDYIHGELYKVTHRTYLYGTLAVTMVLELLLVALWAWMLRYDVGVVDLTAATGFSLLTAMLSVGFYAAALTADMVFSEQYKHNTLKNEVSFGLPRWRIYLGKLGVAAMVSLGLMLVVVVWYAALCQFLLPAGGDWTAALGAVGFSLLVVLPLWLGCLAFLFMLFFLMKGTTAATLIGVGTVAMAGSVLELLTALVSPKFRLLYDILLTTPASDISRHIGDWQRVGWAWAVGLGWILVCTAVGVTAFRKKEIS